MINSSIPNPQETTTTRAYVYIAFGCPKQEPLMKIGKATNLANRQAGLRLKIEFGVPCSSEEGAFVLEDLARAQMHLAGAQRRGTSVSFKPPPQN